MGKLGETVKIALFKVLFLSSFIIPFANATEYATADRDEKCEKALDDAFSSLNQKVAINNTQQLAPANANNSPTGSPLGDLVAKIGEGITKQAEIEQKEFDQKEKVEDERFKQALDFREKLRDYRNECYKLRQEVTSLEFAKKKADLEIKKACDDEADEKYAALFARNNELAASTNFSTNSMSQAAGTRNRMMSQQEVFRQQCLAKPQTQDAFALNVQELNAKLRNLKTESERISSDEKDTKELIPMMHAHMDRKLSNISQSAARQKQALAQANMFNMIALGTAMSTASATASNGAQLATQTNSAFDTLSLFPQISQTCKGENINQFHAVPADVYVLFMAVNKACRPDASPSHYCVQSTNVNSTEMRNRSTTN